MNIQEEFKDWISDLKEYLMNDETIYSKKIVYCFILIYFYKLNKHVKMFKGSI